MLYQKTFAEINERIEKFEGREKRFTEVESKLEGLEKRLTEVESKLEQLRKENASYWIRNIRYPSMQELNTDTHRFCRLGALEMRSLENEKARKAQAPNGDKPVRAENELEYEGDIVGDFAVIQFLDEHMYATGVCLKDISGRYKADFELAYGIKFEDTLNTTKKLHAYAIQVFDILASVREMRAWKGLEKQRRTIEQEAERLIERLRKGHGSRSVGWRSQGNDLFSKILDLERAFAMRGES
ncbi:hypothetical protein AJ80_08344 [Polytolypa hystricis UAMH7299]|uniref:Uncharacterized protein n=1 Tax=Polytolypa hystricis (strain UAMH7299) TaxID=1447883 RepID=A0A2B7X8I7_POLH7|nr:hypothetical protein AJ80_08344 [Polytolypa hystricis UAMH7299]